MSYYWIPDFADRFNFLVSSLPPPSPLDMGEISFYICGLEGLKLGQCYACYLLIIIYQIHLTFTLLCGRRIRVSC